jgi:hypothetical protein
MRLERLLAIVMVLMSGPSHTDPTGTIEGVVLNGSRSGEPIADAEVHLRAGVSGFFEPVDKTNTDTFGKFSFQNIPFDSTITYLPGANHQGVHYPGQRVRFDAINKVAHVKIVAYDAVLSRSPLSVERHDIDIEVGKRVLAITEALLISNRSRSTYVGETKGDEAPITLRLSVPPNFDRVTFDSEFCGRRFRIVDHQLLTDMPWPPGKRELKFTYRMPIEESGGEFIRPLDLPTTGLRVQVQAQDQQVSCNLSRAAAVADRMIFSVKDKQFPVGYTIKVQIGNMPIPWMLYARWASLAVLVILAIGTFCVSRFGKGWRENLNESPPPSGTGTRRGLSARPRAKLAHHLARADRMNL